MQELRDLRCLQMMADLAALLVGHAVPDVGAVDRDMAPGAAGVIMGDFGRVLESAAGAVAGMRVLILVTASVRPSPSQALQGLPWR